MVSDADDCEIEGDGMKDIESLKTIAVLIDADNAQHSKLRVILHELLKHGHVTARKACGDLTSDRPKNWPELLDCRIPRAVSIA